MSPRHLLMLAAVLLLCACPAPQGRLNPGAAFPYVIVSDAEMFAATSQGGRMPEQGRLPGLYPQEGMAALSNWVTSGWCGRHAILELHAGGTPWIAAHECAHLADRVGSMREAIRLLTPPNPNAHMAVRLASMTAVCVEAERRCVSPWRVIRDRWGDEAVVHPTILRRLDAERGF